MTTTTTNRFPNEIAYAYIDCIAAKTVATIYSIFGTAGIAVADKLFKELTGIDPANSASGIAVSVTTA